MATYLIFGVPIIEAAKLAGAGRTGDTKAITKEYGGGAPRSHGPEIRRQSFGMSRRCSPTGSASHGPIHASRD
jgi:hypothetical protein